LAVKQAEKVISLRKDLVDLVGLEEGQGLKPGHAFLKQVDIFHLNALTNMGPLVLPAPR